MFCVPRILPNIIVYIIIDVVVTEVSIFRLTVRLFSALKTGYSILVIQIINSRPSIRKQFLGRFAKSIGSLIIKHRFLILNTSFCRDQHNPITSCRSINRSGRGIFQEAHLIYFIRFQIIKSLFITDNTIDNEQRIAESTTHTDLRRSSHQTRITGNSCSRSTSSQ